jgi:RimJ/RimL family protein N-acetyltransferase
MALYDGPAMSLGNVSLAKPAQSSLATALREAELTDDQKAWFERARHDDACFFFAVCRNNVLVGQAFFHDADWSKHESLVGYHIFRDDQRGHGSGTAALTLLCDYGAEHLRLRRLVAITSTDNRASRGVASRAGFREIGPAREGKHLVACERVC